MRNRYKLLVSALSACVAIGFGTAGAAPDAPAKEAPAKEEAPEAAPEKPGDTVAPGKDTHAKVMDEVIAAMDKMATIIAGATDEASAKVAADKLGKLVPKLKKIGQRAKILGDPDPVLEKELEAKFKPKMEAVQGKLMKSMTGLASNPEAMKHIQGAMEKIGETMNSFDE